MKKRNLLFLAFTLFISPLTYATPSPSVKAEGAILIEPHTQTILYSKNSSSKFYPASTTKVLTSLLLVENMDEQAVITKSPESVANVPSDSSHIGLQVGDKYLYPDGIRGIMMGSDNFISYDMAIYNAGSIKAFANKMNEKAKSLGAKSSNFVNPHGYHDPNHYTTPYDLSLITAAAFDNPTLRQIAGTHEYTFNILNKANPLKLIHTAPFFKKDSPYYNPFVLAAKTGYHTPAGRTLVAKAQYGNLELVAVVMKSDYPGYFEDINTLFDYGSKNFKFLQDENYNVSIKNVSYSDWGAPYVEQALANKWIKSSTISYMDAATGFDFINMVDNMLPYPLKSKLAPYKASSQSSIYKLSHPITRTASAKLFEEIGSSLSLSTAHIQEGVDFILSSKKDSPLTIEECTYLTNLIGQAIITDTLIRH
nr:hypothetical protein [uncultured Niameybacter sp.]